MEDKYYIIGVIAICLIILVVGLSFKLRRKKSNNNEEENIEENIEENKDILSKKRETEIKNKHSSVHILPFFMVLAGGTISWFMVKSMGADSTYRFITTTSSFILCYLISRYLCKDDEPEKMIGWTIGT